MRLAPSLLIVLLLAACYATPREHYDRVWVATHGDLVYRIAHRSAQEEYVGTVSVAGEEHPVVDPHYAEGVFSGHYRPDGERRELRLVYVEASGSGPDTVVLAVEEESGVELEFRRER